VEISNLIHIPLNLELRKEVGRKEKRRINTRKKSK
jgi:hypothetical protein